MDLSVSPSYDMRVGTIGVISCKEKKYGEIKEYIEKMVCNSLGVTTAQLILVTPGRFKVILKGEVDETTEVECWGFTRVSAVLQENGTKLSSKRFVTILGYDGKKRDCDLFQADREGNLTQDPYLLPDDTVIVKKVERCVELKGAVERPGVYELKENDDFAKLISYYGNGFLPNADKERIEITRYSGDSEQERSGSKIYASEKIFMNDFRLENRDVVFVTDLESLKSVVFIEGGIKTSTKGTSLEASSRVPYQFDYGQKYDFFIRNNKDLFTEVSDIQNAYILRKDKKIPLDLSLILYNSDFTTQECIESNDVLIIPFKQFFVTVAGAVSSPGRYPYIPDRAWDYYIGLAGGFDRSRNRGEAVKIKNKNGKKLNKKAAIEPECTITASTNAFIYYFSMYASVISTFISLFLSGVSVYNIFKN